MLSEALYLPWRGDDVAGTMLVGGALCLLATVGLLAGPVAVAVSPLGLVGSLVGLGATVILLGYGVRLLATVADGDRQLPSFVRWGALTRLGVGTSLLLVGISAPLLVLTAFLGSLLVVGSEFDAPLLAVVVAFGSVPLFGLFVAVAYLLPAMLVGFATDGLRGALSIRRALGTGASLSYAVSWLLAGGVLAVGAAVALPLSVLLVGFPIGFYAFVVAGALYAQGYGAANSLRPTGRVDEHRERVPMTEFTNGVETDPTAGRAALVEFDRGVGEALASRPDCSSASDPERAIVRRGGAGDPSPRSQESEYRVPRSR